MGETIFFRIEIIKPRHERQIGNYLSDVAERNRCSSKAERHFPICFTKL